MIVEEVGGVQGQGNPGYFSNINKKWFIAPLALTAACLLAKPLRSYSWAIGPVGGLLVNNLARITFFYSGMQATDEQKMEAAVTMASTLLVEREEEKFDSLECSERVRDMVRRLSEPCTLGELDALVDEFKGVALHIPHLTFVELTGLGHEAQAPLAWAIIHHSPRHLVTDDVEVCWCAKSPFLTIDAREMDKIPALDYGFEVVTLIVKEEELMARAREAKQNITGAKKLLVTWIHEGRYRRTFQATEEQAEPLLGDTPVIPDYLAGIREVMVYGPGGRAEPYVYDAEGLKEMVGQTIESDSVHMREHINRLEHLVS